MPTGNPNAKKIPTSNAVALPSMLSAFAAQPFQSVYSYQPEGLTSLIRSKFIGAFCRKNDEMPSWARDYADWDYAYFHDNHPGKKRKFSDFDAELPRGENADYLNYTAAWNLWDLGGRQGPEPFCVRNEFRL